MFGSDFMSNEEFSEMETELNEAFLDSSNEEDQSQNEVETESASDQQDNEDSSQESSETDDSEAVDVKPAKGEWIPRSRLNQVLEKAKERDARIAELEKQIEESKTSTKTDDHSSDQSYIDELIEDIWGEGKPSSSDKKMLELFNEFKDDLQALKTSRNQELVKRIQNQWQQDIEDINAMAVEKHGFEIPAELIMNGVKASKGSQHPHEVAEKILQWAGGLTKKEAKEIVEEATEDQETTKTIPRSKKKAKRSTKISKTEPEEIIVGDGWVEQAAAGAAHDLGVKF